MDQPSDLGGLFSARRIVVTGGNGAGKTTFAMHLVAQRGLDLFHNNALALATGWERRPACDIIAARKTIAAKDSWVIEGGPSLVVPGPIFDRCTRIIWMDLPAWLRMSQILRRTWAYHHRTRPELPAGNVERFDGRNLRFLVQVWRRDAQVRDTILTASRTVPTLHLRGRRRISDAIQQLHRSKTTRQSAELL